MQCFRVVCVLVSAVVLSVSSQADSVHLLNGDRVTGTVTSIRDGVLTIDTEYFGAQSIGIEKVTRFETARPVALKLSGEEPVEAMVFAVKEGASGEAGAAHLAVPLERVELLAPSLAEIESPEKPKKWSGTVAASASLRTGNTDTLESNLSVTAERDAAWNVLTLKASAAYGEVEDVLNTRRYKGEARWQVYPGTQRYYLYLSGGVEHDAGRKLDLRLNTGAGVGYDFWTRETRKLSADIGLDFSHEEWNPFTPAERDATKESRRDAARAELQSLANASLAAKGTTDAFTILSDAVSALRDFRDPLRFDETRIEEYLNLRTGAHFEQRLFRESWLTEELAVFPSVEDFGELRLTSELVFKTSLNHSLDLRISLKSEYDSRAGESGVESWDNTLLAGIGYSF